MATTAETDQQFAALVATATPAATSAVGKTSLKQTNGVIEGAKAVAKGDKIDTTDTTGATPTSQKTDAPVVGDAPVTKANSAEATSDATAKPGQHHS